MRKPVKTQEEKGTSFRALHERKEAFVIPNPWDAGTARLLEALDFQALATTSAGYAFSLGMKDGRLDRPTTIAHVRAIAEATDLPVSGDLENGFGMSPETAAETIRLAAGAGLVGGSIEDAARFPENQIYELELAVERIQAAAEAAQALPFPFTLTARCENFLYGRLDLEDTITRLRRYGEAGAHVLYAPGLTSAEQIKAVVSAVGKPVNVLMGFQGIQFTLAELSEMGVRRVSVGSALSRIATEAFLSAAREIRETGTFTFASKAIAYADLQQMYGTDRKHEPGTK